MYPDVITALVILITRLVIYDNIISYIIIEGSSEKYIVFLNSSFGKK